MKMYNIPRRSMRHFILTKEQNSTKRDGPGDTSLQGRNMTKTKSLKVL